MNSRVLVWCLVPCVSLVLLVGVDFLLDWPLASKFRENACRETNWLINPDVACGETSYVINKGGYTSLQKELVTYIAARQADASVREVALYYRDLHNGPTFGINETEDFAAASLLKLPIAVAYLSKVEEQPDLLGKKLAFRRAELASLEQTFPSGIELDERMPYAVEELMKNMITHSDNLSYLVLIEYFSATFGDKELLQIFGELGIVDPKDYADEVVSVRGYASLFRMLYHSSYLSPELSNKLLGWLLEVDFNRGLIAGLPEGTPVAHKFGERFLDDGTKQLHDCGIIYFPGNPYLLCVMTKGDDWGALETVIADISRAVYTEVDSRRL